MATETQTEHTVRDDRRDSHAELGWVGTETPALDTGAQTPATIRSHGSQERLFFSSEAAGDSLQARLTEAAKNRDENHEQPRQEEALEVEPSTLRVDDGLGQELRRYTSARDDDPGRENVLERRTSRRDSDGGSSRDRRLSNRIDGRLSTSNRNFSPLPSIPADAIELGTFPELIQTNAQGKPPELPNLVAEVIFIFVCSTGQLLFAILLGNITVNQVTLIAALGIKPATTPWLTGAFMLTNGLSVVISGSLADLAGPRIMMVSAFVWLTVWNIVGAFSISPARYVLFFVVRAMQGLAVGVLVSASMSVLGRIYKPGMRKTRVFSSMAAMAPLGFWIGTLQGGALSSHIPWIFASTAMLCCLCAVAAFFTIPAIGPAKDTVHDAAPSLRDFDFAGASCAAAGCACFLFGLTQGAPSGWSPYTYVLILVGLAFFVAFYFVERRAPRPLIENRLWLTPGFAPLTLSYFLGFGAYCGAWQFYAVRFWLTLQSASPLTAALWLTPNAIVGVLATFIVSKTLHIVAGHWILTASMLAYAMGPVFFLPQTAGTTYWALSMPGIALVTFGPDLSFAAASIFITSSVKKSYQGSAGSVLVTVQNLSAAVFTAVGDAIGTKVSHGSEGELTLEGLRAIWWFGFGTCVLATAICALTVRIPKSEEKEHVN